MARYVSIPSATTWHQLALVNCIALQLIAHHSSSDNNNTVQPSFIDPEVEYWRRNKASAETVSLDGHEVSFVLFTIFRMF